MKYKNWTITFSNPDWIEKEVKVECSPADLNAMTRNGNFSNLIEDTCIPFALSSWWEGQQDTLAREEVPS